VDFGDESSSPLQIVPSTALRQAGSILGSSPGYLAQTSGLESPE
jgi:hypothetical protein